MHAIKLKNKHTIKFDQLLESLRCLKESPSYTLHIFLVAIFIIQLDTVPVEHIVYWISILGMEPEGNAGLRPTQDMQHLVSASRHFVIVGDASRETLIITRQNGAYDNPMYAMTYLQKLCKFNDVMCKTDRIKSGGAEVVRPNIQKNNCSQLNTLFTGLANLAWNQNVMPGSGRHKTRNTSFVGGDWL